MRPTAKTLSPAIRRALTSATLIAALPLLAGGCLEEYIDLRPDRGVPSEAGVDQSTPDSSGDLRDIPPACNKPADVVITGGGSNAAVLYGLINVGFAMKTKTKVYVRLVDGSKPGFPESPNGFTQGGGGEIGKPSDTFSFKAFDVPNGTYTLYAWADINENGVFDEGDVAGYYLGTFLSPIDSGDSATPIVLAGSSRCSLNFGIGAYAPKP
jgi:hypothetical protein